MGGNIYRDVDLLYFSAENDLQKAGLEIATCECFSRFCVACSGRFTAPLEVTISSLEALESARQDLSNASKLDI